MGSPTTRVLYNSPSCHWNLDLAKKKKKRRTKTAVFSLIVFLVPFIPVLSALPVHVGCMIVVLLLPCHAVVSCGNPGQPVNGQRSDDSFDFGSTVTYTCGAAYRLDGSSTATCQADGTWSSAVPTCSGKGKREHQVQKKIHEESGRFHFSPALSRKKFLNLLLKTPCVAQCSLT